MIIGRVNEVVVFFCNDIIDCYASLRKSEVSGILHEDCLALVAFQISTIFVPEAGRRLSIAKDFRSSKTANTPVVRRQNDLHILLRGKGAEHTVER